MSPDLSLEIAAPAAALDPLAPWIGARTTPERALAATYWTSFGGLSGLFHVSAVFLSLVATLLPIPFLSDACAPVKPVTLRPPERVEVAIVKVEPPPKLEEIPPPPPVEELAPKGAKAKRLARDAEVMEAGLIAILGSADSSQGILASLDSAGDAQVFGALMGDQIGDAFGAGGLGLSGVGVAGGVEGGLAGGASVGLGGLGTIGHGAGGGTGEGYGVGGLGGLASGELRVDIVDTELDRELARVAIRRKASALKGCRDELPVDLTLRVTGGKVTAVEGAPPCVARALRELSLPGDGYVAAHLSLR